MTRVLTASSIVYAGILVAALAIVLATILVMLVRVTRTLGRVQNRLRDVVRYTQPLVGQLGAVTTAEADGQANPPSGSRRPGAD